MAIDIPGLCMQPKVITADGPDPKIFFLSDDEHTALRLSYTWLVQRILIEEIPQLTLCDIPSVLSHKYRDIADRPSLVHPMFVIMKDPKSLPNCVQIMDTILDTLRSFYVRAGRGEEFETIATIPLGGDQLTRVTFDSARHLRAGAHTRSERFEQFIPVIEEMFHVQQDLLEFQATCQLCLCFWRCCCSEYHYRNVRKLRQQTLPYLCKMFSKIRTPDIKKKTVLIILQKIIKKFYTTDSCREVGTLSNYKAVLHRTNVNIQVKSNGFEAHKDFVFTVARALIVELACEKLGLENKTDMHNQLPKTLKCWSRQKRNNWLDDKVKAIVDALFCSYTAPNMNNVMMVVQLNGITYNVTVPAQHQGQEITINLNGQNVKIAVPDIGNVPEQTHIDDLYNYSVSFLRAAMDFMLLDYVIKAADIDRLTILMKRFIALYVGLASYRSKYAIECVNFLTKTEWFLSDYESVRVKIGAFVNKKGEAGKNKASDMQQENNIKLVKNVIRGLGAGKIDKAMERSSKSAPVISKMTGVRSSVGLKSKDKHQKKSLTEDMSLLETRMRALKPFRIVRNRVLPSYSGIHSNVISKQV